MIDHAVGRGWWPQFERNAFNFALAYGDDSHNSRQVSHIRAMRSRQLLGDAGKAGLVDLMRVLRDHYEGMFLRGPMFSADNPDFLSLCMHDSRAGFTWGDTASTAIVTLPREGEGLAVWWGGLVTPRTGAFVPYSIDSGIPARLARAGEAGLNARDPAQASPDAYSQDSPWREFYDLLDTVRCDSVDGT